MWYKIAGQMVELRILVKPNSRRNEITGITERGLGIALRAQPKEGEANAALIEFLSERLGVPKSRIALVRGMANRSKIVSVPLTAEVQAFLAEFLP